MIKNKKQKECDHTFQSDPPLKLGERPHYEIAGLGETLEKDVRCDRCGVRAREVWIYSGTFDEAGQQI